jgi:hypothetical protein
VEVLARFAVDDGFDLASGDPDADGSGLDAGYAGGFPEVTEVPIAFEVGEVDVDAVRVGVGDHGTSPGCAKAPTGLFTAGAPEA